MPLYNRLRMPKSPLCHESRSKYKRQGIPLHGDETEADNNFIQFLKLYAVDDTTILQYLVNFKRQINAPVHKNNTE